MERILTKIKTYAIELFNRRNAVELKYHNLQHTESVVERATEIAAHYPLTELELFCLISAAWFHDTGHLFNELKEHERAGSDLMSALLTSLLVEKEIIREISDCILVTKMPSAPKNIIQEIICDADTYHFGTKEFLITDGRVYEEIEARLGISIENKTGKTIRLLESHQFFTSYCQDLLNNGKKANIDFLKKHD